MRLSGNIGNTFLIFLNRHSCKAIAIITLAFDNLRSSWNNESMNIESTGVIKKWVIVQFNIKLMYLLAQESDHRNVQIIYDELCEYYISFHSLTSINQTISSYYKSELSLD